LVWHGGMNLLGKVDAYDNLIRLENEQVAAELLEMTDDMLDDDKRDIDKLETLIDKYGAANNIQFNIDSYSAGEELF